MSQSTPSASSDQEENSPDIPSLSIDDLARSISSSTQEWSACGDGDCPCVTIWHNKLGVPILRSYREEWGDEYPVVKVEIDHLSNEPENARISAVMDKIVYGYIDPKFSAKIVKQVTRLPTLIEAVDSFMEEMEGTLTPATQTIRGLTSFKELTNALSKIKGE